MSKITRRDALKTAVLGAGAAMFGPSLSAFAAAAEPTGVLRMAVTTFGPETWDPIIGDATTANAMVGPLYDWLVAFENGKPAPGVLESFVMSPDGMYWDLKLRSGLKFHDGSPATVKDLEFTIERYRSKEAVRSNLRTSVTSTEVIDDLTLRVHLQKPLPYFPYYLSNTVPNQGNLMPKDYIEKNGLQYFTEHPIGVGPWKFESQVVGTSHTYTAVTDHWRRTPGFQTLKVTLVPELDTQLALLRSGDLDVAYLSIEDAAGAQQMGLTTYDLFAPAVRIDFKGAYDDRGKDKPIANIKVREALARAIDFDAINSSLFNGKAFPRVPPRALYGMDEVDPKWTDYIEKTLQTYDPERAKVLLGEAGLGGGFSLDVFVANFGGIPYLGDLSGAVQAYWAEIGVTANLIPLEIAEYNKLIVGPQDRAVGSAMFGNTGTLGAAPNNFEYLWGSRGGSTLFARQAEDGTVTAYLPELDAALYGSQSELDPTKRKELIDKFIQLGLDTYTSVVFGQVPTTVGVVKGVRFEGMPKPSTTQHVPAIAEFGLHD